MQSRPDGLYLAFDYGLRYIGVASGHTQSGTSSPLCVIRNHNGTPDWDALDECVRQWQPAGMVVGVPLRMDGSEQPLSGQARGFAKRLRKRYALSVFTADERLTTQQAGTIIRENRQRGQRRKTSKADLDKIAAALILRNWFTAHDDD
ncbi:Holliday junction resolvase RuvX [Granulosicoccaceae sp. 1_MG-2023]|nr:Holliday junction resolvase RuvX [Granulosicoccaceae sp. 1_MG-2023]